MSTTREDICDELEVDLCLARLELVAARARLRLEDTAANRAAVAFARARLDVTLDLLVELAGAVSPRPVGPRAGTPPVPPRLGMRRPAPRQRDAGPPSVPDGPAEGPVGTSGAGGEQATLRAAAALPCDDRGRAVRELRTQLRVMAVAAGATPDWRTLTVSGPTEMAGADEWSRFEWAASVAVRTGSPSDQSLLEPPGRPRRR